MRNLLGIQHKWDIPCLAFMGSTWVWVPHSYHKSNNTFESSDCHTTMDEISMAATYLRIDEHLALSGWPRKKMSVFGNQAKVPELDVRVHAIHGKAFT